MVNQSCYPCQNQQSVFAGTHRIGDSYLCSVEPVKQMYRGKLSLQEANHTHLGQVRLNEHDPLPSLFWLSILIFW